LNIPYVNNKKFWRDGMLFLFLISAFSFIPKEKPVAIVGNEKIFEKDIPSNLSLDQHLQNLVFFELAKEKGYDDSVKTRIDQSFNQEIARRTVRRFSKTATQPTLYDCALFYRNSKKKLEVQLIQTRNFGQAVKAYIEVLKGENFGAVSEKYSFNPSIKKTKGILSRPISWSSSFPRSFGLIFKMNKGDVSVPLKFGESWNIFKIIDVIEESGENAFDRNKMLEEIKNPRLRLQVSRDKNSLYMYKFRNFIPWIANPRVDSKGASLLVERITAPEEKFMKKGFPFGEEDLDVVLAESVVGEYKIRDFIEDASLAGGFSQFGNKESAVQFIKDNIFNRTLIAMCRRLGGHREPSLLKGYKQRVRDAALDFFKRREILPIIKETEDDLKDFYENNKARYEVAESRKVSLIEVKEEKKAQEIRKRLMKGERFEPLAKEVSIGSEKGKGGDIGYIREEQKGAIGREAFRLRKGEISKVFKAKKGWAIIKVKDIKKSYLPGYSDVKATVRTDYRESKAKEIGNRIFEQNKDKYSLKILD
jgi:parvulin-like peptidyl-prolyl isomerase